MEIIGVQFTRKGQSRSCHLASPFPAPDDEPEATEPGPAEPGLASPEDRPNVIRKQEGRYPPRSHEHEDDAGDRADVLPDPDDERPPAAPADDGAEERTRERPRRAEGGAGPLPELPDNLFEWPDSLKEARPWDRSRETQRPGREERGESQDPAEDANLDENASADEDANREEGTDPGAGDGPRP